MNRRFLICLGTILIFTLLAHAATSDKPVAFVTRGPYLQLGTTNSIVVRWRTSVPMTSQVRYGSSTDSLTNKATSKGTLSDHVVMLSGLKPDTRYFYSIGSTTETLAGGGNNYYFFTSPMYSTPKPTRVWVLGDPGTQKSGQKHVRDAYYKFTGPRHTDLWLMLGDNAYSAGTDAEYQGAVFQIYGDMLKKSVLWPTLGNHDAGSANSSTQSGVYFDIFTLPTQGQAGGVMSGTEAYYSFNFANIHFVCLNSEDLDRTANGLMLKWLKADLAANHQDWTIAYWHHPPYSKGSHDTDSDKDSDGRMHDMRVFALPILEDGGVDVILCGHSHAYERSFLVDGHYDKSMTYDEKMIKDARDGRIDGQGAYHKPSRGPAPHEGTIYLVAGSAGQISGGKLVYPAMYESLNVLGSVVLDFDGNRLDATFLDERGARRDYFTIFKGSK